MSVQLPGPLVSPAWLAANLARPGLKLMDASWYLPAEKRDPAAEFEAEHIEGAVFFDIDGVRDPDNPLPHMLPSAPLFAEEMARLGISNSDTVIVYDGAGLFSAPRAWWTLRIFGHDNVAVLNGGLPAWRAANLPIVAGRATSGTAKFKAIFRPELVRDLAQMLGNLEQGAEQVIDARGPGRFDGSEPEIRAGVRSGHIPGSVNLPYPVLIDAVDKSLLPPDLLAAAFAECGVDLARPVVTTCGSGISASLLALALFVCGHTGAAVYDGSWTEWGGRSDTPTESS
ncbi:MAG: 3-mercaptopyruvate sulfurtransferase [Proteobacteria bacterium]|nr:3-mercaptopyruvate sulfurtransferase [Pseudomonadota bacterium]MDA1356312.1 3-mercaptopyruvate sulfurtransferase [Pseudomonadota bacterium]